MSKPLTGMEVDKKDEVTMGMGKSSPMVTCFFACDPSEYYLKLHVTGYFLHVTFLGRFLLYIAIRNQRVYPPLP